VYVKRSKQKNGRVSISIAEGRWEDGTSRSRTVMGFGYLDVLESAHPDALGYVQGICDRLNAEKAEAKHAVSLEVHPMQKIDARTGGLKNIGCAIPLAYYRLLGIERTLRNRARGKGHKYDVNAVMRLLVLERMIAPGSKKAAWENRDGYFFRSDFSPADVYRSLDFFAHCKEALVAAANKAVSAHHKRDLEDAYYDVTNYYFEIDAPDGLRKEGVSKERRRRPIVQMGLMQDKDGIPMSFNVFPGDTPDCLTMLPAMAQAKRDLGCGRMVMVAGKGLNTSTNIAAITLDKNGFVFPQSIRGTKSPASLTDWVVSPEGHRAKKDDRDGPGFKVKSRLDTKAVYVEGADGKRHRVDIDVKVVAFWSAKYDRRAKRERAKVVERAHALVKDPGAYERATHYGAAKYVRNITFDKKTGEALADAGKHPCIDEGLIARQERLDGYYVIITSEMQLSDERIIEIYRGLWRIEEAFKVTKSCLGARPVFVWTPAHIHAHFLICYLALMIIRLIQYDTGFAYSAEPIIEEIAKMRGVRLEDNWWRFFHRSALSDKLAATVGLDLTRMNLRLSEVKGLLAKARLPQGK